jgi:hypothetical protein
MYQDKMNGSHQRKNSQTMIQVLLRRMALFVRGHSSFADFFGGIFAAIALKRGLLLVHV